MKRIPKIFFIASIVMICWLYINNSQAIDRRIATYVYTYRDNVILHRVINITGDSDKPFDRYLAKAHKLVPQFFSIIFLIIFGTYVILRKFKDSGFVFWALIFLLFIVKLMDAMLPEFALNDLSKLSIILWALSLSTILFLYMQAQAKKKIIFSLIIGLFISVSSLIAFEAILSFSNAIPPFPKNLTRPERWNVKQFNSMGFLDKERSFKNPDNSMRILFIGDSFLEIFGVSFVPKCEELVKLKVKQKIEFINLGESATDPVDYYWRLERVGLRFKPDMILVFICEVNDFMPLKRVKRGLTPNNLLARYPQPSIFSRFFPKTTALATATGHNVIGLFWRAAIDTDKWERLPDNKKEIALIEIVSKKANISLNKAREYVDSLSPSTKKFIFDARYLPEYSMRTITKGISNRAAPYAILNPEYAADCILEMKHMLLQKGNSAKIAVFFIPEGEKVDPVYLNAYQYLVKTKDLPFGPLLTENAYSVFSKKLAAEDIELFDLSEILKDVPGCYSLDGHWSKKGIVLAAKYIASKLIAEIAHLKNRQKNDIVR